MLDRSIATTARACDGVVVALPPESGWQPAPPVVVVAGGATRAESVRAAPRRSCRPTPRSSSCTTPRVRSPRALLFAAVIDAVRAGADAAIPALAVTDTVKRVADDRVLETVPRDGLVVVQTPQAFRADVRCARTHSRAADASDDAMLVEQAGGVVPHRRGRAPQPEDHRSRRSRDRGRR